MMLNRDDKEKIISALKKDFEFRPNSRDKNKLSFIPIEGGGYLGLTDTANRLAAGFKYSERPYTATEICECLRDFQTEYIENNKMPSIAKPKLVIKDLGVTASWIYEILHAPDCPLHISDRGDSIEFRADGVSIAGNDKLVRAWLTSKVKDMDLQKVYREGDLDAGWLLLKQKFQTAAKATKNNLIAFDGNPFVDEFLHYIYDYLQIKEDYDVYEMMFKHWMWCLKRRMFNKPVIWHIWLNFNGAQGIGKTQMINRMLRFIEDFIITTNLRIMNDVDREYRKFTDNYVIIFDDLNTGENSDNDVSLNDNAVDAIKQIMTQEVFTVRQFQTQDQNKVKNTFVPISTANRHLYDIIYDGDAMRRWFEFNCQRSTPPESYDELNAILERFPEALRGIDENNDKGYWDRQSAVSNKIVEIQKHYIPTNTSTNTWIDYCHVTPDFDRSPETAFMAPAYKQYSSYCRAVGKHTAGLQRVTMILGRLWPECIDEKGIAHVFIESKIDDTTGDLIINDVTKLEPIAFTKSTKVAKLGGVNDFD